MAPIRRRLRRWGGDAILPGMTCRDPGPRRLHSIRQPLAAIALLAATGCASAERPAAGSPAGSITLALHQRGGVDGFVVTPLRVDEDSRCPAEVQCIQAGTVRLAVRIAGRARLQPVLKLAKPSRLDSDSWLILCGVTPYPARPGRIGPSAYRFSLVLRHGASPPAACPAPAPASGD